MPQIIVTAGDAAGLTDEKVMLRERIKSSDFESDRFATNLLERLGWAVCDAAEIERRGPDATSQVSDREDAARERDTAPERDAAPERNASKELVEA